MIPVVSYILLHQQIRLSCRFIAGSYLFSENLNMRLINLGYVISNAMRGNKLSRSSNLDNNCNIPAEI